MEATETSTGRQMNKKAVVHSHNSAIKKNTFESVLIEVDETGACYTQWSKSERKIPIQYIKAYMWNLERCWWWPYMQDNKRDTDVKNRLLDSVGEGEVWNMYIIICEIDHLSKFDA